MHHRVLHEADGLRTFAVVMEKGDDAPAELEGFAQQNGITAASLTGVGACKEATLAYFDPETLRYENIPVTHQAEVLSLIGDVAEFEDQPAVHAHCVLGLRDGRTVGGHLKRALVWPTLEVVVVETPAHLRKRVDPGTGLALITDIERRA